MVFDYGNVLCEPQHAAEITAMAKIVGLPEERFEAIYWRHRLEYDEAKLDAVEYWHKFAPVTSAQIEQLNGLDATSWAHPAAAIPEWARQLRAAGFRIALLSNMPFTVRDAVLGCGWLPEFDQRTFSCELRISKPAAEIYQHCLRGLGIAPEDALFLDDRPSNAEGASAVGMHSLVYSSASALFSELGEKFEIPLPGKGEIGI